MGRSSRPAAFRGASSFGWCARPARVRANVADVRANASLARTNVAPVRMKVTFVYANLDEVRAKSARTEPNATFIRAKSAEASEHAAFVDTRAAFARVPVALAWTRGAFITTRAASSDHDLNNGDEGQPLRGRAMPNASSRASSVPREMPRIS